MEAVHRAGYMGRGSELLCPLQARLPPSTSRALNQDALEGCMRFHYIGQLIKSSAIAEWFNLHPPVSSPGGQGVRLKVATLQSQDWV